MISVALPEEDWKRLTSLLATKLLWVEANPFLIAIGTQIQAAQAIETARGRPNGPLEGSEGPVRPEGPWRPS
jgi:hypothetical protein